MFNRHFNHQLLRKYIVAFGQFFDKIVLVRDDADGTEVQRMVVPIDFGPKERWYLRLKQDPDLKRGTSTIVPRLAYDVTGVNYDAGRKLNTLHQMTFHSSELNRLARQYVGVPYNLNFELSILTKHQSDALQIVEQIIPFFTPDLTFAMMTLPELGLVDQIPLTLTSVNHSDNYEGDFEHRRAVIWNLGFTMKVNLYGPTKSAAPIKEVFIDLYNVQGDLSSPPEFIETENGDLFTMEDGTGHMLSEATSNTYYQTGRVARVHSVLDPLDQTPSENPSANTTLEETSQDVKRNLVLDDEET